MSDITIIGFVKSNNVIDYTMLKYQKRYQVLMLKQSLNDLLVNQNLFESKRSQKSHEILAS